MLLVFKTASINGESCAKLLNLIPYFALNFWICLAIPGRNTIHDFHDPLADLGGWPEISADREPAGSDGSGLADARDGLRPSFDLYDPQDAWAKLPGAETSNLEHYLARLAGDA